jgi:hypothetical protein
MPNLYVRSATDDEEKQFLMTSGGRNFHVGFLVGDNVAKCTSDEE